MSDKDPAYFERRRDDATRRADEAQDPAIERIYRDLAQNYAKQLEEALRAVDR